MTNWKKLSLSALITLAALTGAQAESYAQTEKGKAFIQDFSGQYGYTSTALTEIFSQVSRDDKILEKISRPAEKTTPWYKYRRIFLDDKRMQNGVIFFRANEKILTEAHKKYGVSPYVITAIIGVETRYGKVMGNDKVITALATIGFDYPKREKFFTKELRAFLQMAAEEGFSPLSPKGSYAGAMGMTQFMPSSYLHFAVDYEGDGKRDLWTNPKDAIFSVANYLAENGWQRDAYIVDDALLFGKHLSEKVSHKPFTTVAALEKSGIFLGQHVVPESTRVGFLELEGEDYLLPFITFKNFAVITTYNTSPMYAMAVTELARAIEQQNEK